MKNRTLLALAWASIVACQTETEPDPTPTDSVDDTATGTDSDSGTAVAPTCDDGVQNGDELGVDCGGSCDPCPLAHDCAELLAADGSLPSGTYPVDVDGAGALPAMTVQCDMTTDGGGWMLVLHYLRQAGTTPPVSVLTTSLPLGGGSFGEDGSLTPETWGHAGNALLSALRVGEMRFFGRTSEDERVIDFITRSPQAIAYAQTGKGSMAEAFSAGYTRPGPERNHTSLPLFVHQTNRGATADQGDLALTVAPLYGASTIDGPEAWWQIGTDGKLWAADQTWDEAYSHDLEFAVWVRPEVCADGVRDLTESDVDCGGVCGGCAAEAACDDGSDCLSGACVDGTCGAGLASSCLELQGSGVTEDGVYTLSLADEDFDVYCDMTFDGGGWTMILSTADGGSPYTATAGDVLPGTTAYLPEIPMENLASQSAQVHVRTRDTEASRSITSVAGQGPAMSNLAGSEMLEHGSSGPASLGDWTGPFADSGHLQFSCATFNGGWPSVYQACGGEGMHLWTTEPGHSRWRWAPVDPAANEPMEVYVR